MGDLKMSKRLSDILATARTVVSQLDLDKALSVVLKKSMEATRTKAGSIALYDAQANSLCIRAHRGFSRNFISNREWKVRRAGLSDRVLRAKGVTVISDTTNKAFFSNPVAVNEGIKSLVCVPPVHQKRPVGILYVDDFTPRKFLKADLQELEILASFAAIAIQHAKAHGREFPLDTAFFDDFERRSRVRYVLGEVWEEAALAGAKVPKFGKASWNDPTYFHVGLGGIDRVYLRKQCGRRARDDDAYHLDEIEVALYGPAGEKRVFRSASAIWLGVEYGAQEWLPDVDPASLSVSRRV